MEDKEIADLLLTWDEYNQKEFTVPYVFTIRKGQQELIYIGMTHSYDPKNEQFDELKKQWNEMCNSHTSSDIVAVTETKITITQENIDEAILDNAETGAIFFLGKEKDILVLCFELSRSEMILAMFKIHTMENIFYHKIAQMVSQWNRMVNKPTFTLWIQRYIDRDKNSGIMPDFDFSLDHIKKIHHKLFATEFDENDKIFFDHATNPAEEISIINQISIDMNLVRNTVIVKGILAEWQKGKSIFVVYGSGHAVIQERALKTLLK